MKSLVFVAAVIGATTAAGLQAVETGPLDSYSFEDYATAFGKTYATPAERESREAIFARNLAVIKAHNANPDKLFVMAVNHMADMTDEEFRAVSTGHTPVSRRGLAPYLRGVSTIAEAPKKHTSIAAALDWRNHSVVTPVKNQGGCGSCWAFASVANMESHYAIKTGELHELSTQQVTSCTENPRECGGTGGCQGATNELGYEYAIRANGLVLERDYPYTGTDGRCEVPYAFRKAHFSSYVRVEPNSQEAVLEALQTGPLTISVWATPMQFYSRGIFSGCDYSKNMAINHAVQLVGYGTEAGKDYWIVRNSWGANWGEKGYIRLLREKEPKCGLNYSPKDGTACKDDPDTPIKVCGQCGILSETSYPIPQPKNV